MKSYVISVYNSFHAQQNTDAAETIITIDSVPHHYSVKKKLMTTAITSADV